MELWRKLRDDALVWCKERNWLVRLPLLIFFIYALVRHLSDPLYTSILGSLNLGIHELGHFVFMFMGEFLGIAGGTILQLSIPLFGIYNFLRQDDLFASTLCLGWLSTNFFNIAVYAADARKLELPLVSPFGGGDGDVYHDWEYLLSKMNILEYDMLIAAIFRIMGIVSMAICLFAGSWLLWQMIKNSRKVY